MNMDDNIERERSSNLMTANCKLASDSGYGSNKSVNNSQSQRSSGSSKSQHSSILSSGSSTGYPPHPNAALQITDYKGYRKTSLDKNEQASKEQKSSLEQNNTPNMGTISMPSFPGTPSQLSPGAGNLDSKALQMAALTHALCCIKKFQQEPYSGLDAEVSEEALSSAANKWQQYFVEELKDEGFKDDGFAAAVSIDDGVVMYITATITNVLGFPKDMLIGRSFIDFIHPKDRMAFASHITCGIKFPSDGNPTPNHNAKQGPNVKSEQFFCRLRQYRGLKSVGFGVTDKTVVYYPFKLTMKLKKSDDANNAAITNSTSSSKQQSPIHLIIVATRIKSAYQYPGEVPTNPGKFVTRHSASCHFGHMDTDAISYLGHLPQDLIGNSVLDYYHPEDMAILKDIYEGVMQEQGKPFRSRPYRFRVFNGSFAMLETDWSSFVNPWSFKLEFVIGQHRVLQGPANPNVFMPPREEDELLLPEAVINDGKETQEEIKNILDEAVTRRLSDPIKLQSSKRRKLLAALMDTFLEQMGKESTEKSGSQCSGMFSVMERDSVMLGEISPHHDDYSGSNQSSETPPSYNQLNYKENIERFFQSQPKTSRSDESGDMSNKIETQQSSQNRSSGDESKSSPHPGYSSGSNRMFGKSRGSNESDDRKTFDTCSMILTEDIISRHNEDMEKYMIQRHRELRGKQNSCTASQKECRHKISEKMRRRKQLKESDPFHQEANHGVKRTGNVGWDRENQTAMKYPHLERHPETSLSRCPPRPSNSNDLWPPFSISTTPGYTTTSYRSTGAGEMLSTPSGMGVSGYPYYQPPVQRIPKTNQAPLNSYPNMETNMNNRPSLVFVPGQQNFIPQQVQYTMPTGVVYQPIALQIVGQSAPILMPNILSPAVLQQTQPLAVGASVTAITEQAGTKQSMSQSGINIITMPNHNSAPNPPNTVEKHSTSRSHAVESTASASVVIRNCSVSTRTRTQQKLACTQRRTNCSRENLNKNQRGMNSNTINVSSKSSSAKIYHQVQRQHTLENYISSSSAIQSSSDGFASKYLNDSSSSSLSSVVKNGTGMKRNSNYATDDIDRYSFQSDAEGGDQDMLWASHAERTELAGLTLKETKRMRSKVPPWMENVNMTEDVAYRYKVPDADLSEILQRDLQALKIFGKQSSVVNEQLSMLYKEIESEQPFGNLEEESSESGSCGENPMNPGAKKPTKGNYNYAKMAVFYEENAPFPSSSD